MAPDTGLVNQLRSKLKAPEQLQVAPCSRGRAGMVPGLPIFFGYVLLLYTFRSTYTAILGSGGRLGVGGGGTELTCCSLYGH